MEEMKEMEIAKKTMHPYGGNGCLKEMKEMEERKSLTGNRSQS